MFPKHLTEKFVVRPKSSNQFHRCWLASEIDVWLFNPHFNFALNSYSCLCLHQLDLRSINLSSLQLNSFLMASSSLGSEICSTEPTMLQKCSCIFSLFLSASMSERLVILIVERGFTNRGISTLCFILFSLRKTPTNRMPLSGFFFSEYAPIYRYLIFDKEIL